MIRIFAGMVLGWMAFTPEGKKLTNAVTKKALNEVQKTLKETGIIEDDVSKPESASE